ncbi:MAG: hypothetical protein GX758_02040 [Tenericutes bacterium]|nr:hypothetical protein [Mycoplasmatota bacterium]
MKRIVLCEETLHEEYPVLQDTVHHESDIYLYDPQTLYKILLSDNRLTREHVVERLAHYDNPNCIIPESIIYNEYNEFVGYSMKYLKTHILSTKIIFGNDDYDYRMFISKKISKIIESFDNDDFVYWDIHPDNVMIRGNCIKVIDIDSIRYFDGLHNELYDDNKIASHQLLCQLALSYLSKMDVLALGRTLEGDILKECFAPAFQGKELSDILDNVFGYPEEILFPSQFIDYIKEKDLSESRNLLIRKLTK